MRRIFKRLFCALVVVCVLVGMEFIFPVKTEAYTSLPDNLYLAQEGNSTCTLSSAAMMLRARMYLCGNSDWSAITESAIRSTAWAPGLCHSWTYKINGSSISVEHAEWSDGVSLSDLKSLLDKHPEGIVFYVRDLPHAVFVTDYEGDTIYCADPVAAYSGKRIPLFSSYLGKELGSQANILSRADDYWYVSSYSGYFHETNPPSFYNLRVADVSPTGYTVYCDVLDDSGVSVVKFPTWTEPAQDDILLDWQTNDAANGARNGDTYSFRVKRADHNYETGPYQTHVYAYDIYGNWASTGVDWCGGAVTLPTEAEVDAGLPDDFYAYIENEKTGLVLERDPTGFGNGDYSAIFCGFDGAATQTWHFIKNSNGTYRISPMSNEDIALHMYGGFGYKENKVLLHAVGDYVPAQQWYIYKIDGYYRLRPAVSDDCYLDLPGASNIEGTAAQIYTFNNNIGAQEMNIIPADFEAPVIDESSVVVTGLCPTSFKVGCNVTDNRAIRHVDFVSWHEDDTDNVVTKIGTYTGGDAYSRRISMSEYGNASGKYTVSIIAYDTAGNVSSTEVTVDVPGEEEVAAGLPDDFYAYIENDCTGLVLSRSAEGWGNGDYDAVFNTRTGSLTQIWHFTKNPNGTYQLKPQSNEALALQTFTGSGENETNVLLHAAKRYESSSSATQQWHIYKMDGHYIIRPAISADCYLDLPGGDYIPGASAWIYRFNGTDAQRFNIIPCNDEGELVATGTFDGREYRVYDLNLTWSEARYFCENLGGNLVSITSQEEQNFVADLIDGAGNMNMYWIGANAESGTFRWSDGEAFEYSNWDYNEPNGVIANGVAEEYAQIYNKANPRVENSQKFKWNDAQNDNKFAGEEDFFGFNHVGFVMEIVPEECLHIVEAKFKGNDIGNKCEVSFVCSACDEVLETVTVEAEGELRIEPTCTEPGIMVYRASARYNGEFFEESYEREIIHLGHTYSHCICTTCGADAVTAKVGGGNVTVASDELEKGTVLLFACYSGDGRMISVNSRVWSGGEESFALPEGASWKLMFTDGGSRLLRTALTD